MSYFLADKLLCGSQRQATSVVVIYDDVMVVRGAILLFASLFSVSLSAVRSATRSSLLIPCRLLAVVV